MALPGWPHADSPFHDGEQAVQQRLGVFDRMREVGHGVIRGVMPAQHREFFEQLPFVALGGVDGGGQPWATLLAGDAPGFVRSPDDTTLVIAARLPEGDPLARSITPGASLGLLGIELETRRRNRANGVVTQVADGGFTLQVRQSFGNCPKYIQRRERAGDAASATPQATPRNGDRLDAASAALVRRADTLFIATHAAGTSMNAGTDVSHRGGRPGFVQVSDDGRTLAWPDYAGNSFYNTLGNLALDARAGLVVPDLESGDLLHVAGRVEIVWDGPQVAAMPGAQRLLRLRVAQALMRPAALPLRWRLVENSPFLP